MNFLTSGVRTPMHTKTDTSFVLSVVFSSNAMNVDANAVRQYSVVEVSETDLVFIYTKLSHLQYGTNGGDSSQKRSQG